MEHDAEQARRHARLVGGDDPPLIFTLKDGKFSPGHGDGDVYITMNATRGGRRRREDVVRIRAVWVDDDVPGPMRTDWPIEPSFVVESSTGRFHYVWLTSHDRVDDFDAVMRGMPGDPAAKDAARVLRLAGTWNHKRGAMARLVADSGRVYTWAEIEAAFPPVRVERAGPAVAHPEPERADSALMAIPPLPRGDPEYYRPWLELMFAHKAAGGTLEALLAWTDDPEKERETRDIWKHAKPDGGIGPGTLYKLAQAHGWIDPTEQGAAAVVEALKPLDHADLIGEEEAAALAARELARISMAPSVAAAAVERVRAKTGVEISPYSADGFPDLTQARTWATALRHLEPVNLDADTRVHWLVEPWIQQGKVGAVVAAGGTGKTTFLIALFIHIGIGRPFAGFPVRQGSCLLISNDDTQEDLDAAFVEVLRAMPLTQEERELARRKVRVFSTIGLQGTKTFTTMQHGAAAPTNFVAMLQEATSSIPDLVVVALDTLRQFSGGSSNDEQVIKITIEGATQFANARGATVIFPHHTGKQNYRSDVTDMYAGSGSAAIADNSRFVLLLQSAEWSDLEDKIEVADKVGRPLVLTSTRGSLRVITPPPMYLRRSGYLIDRIEGRVFNKDERAHKRDVEILRAVDQGAQSKNAIFQRVGGGRNALIARVDKLVGCQWLTEAPYKVTDLGRVYLDDEGAPLADL